MAVIGVIGCAAGGVEQLRNELVAPLLDAGHTVPVTLTPTAYAWLDANGERDRIEAATELPVRGTSRLPWEPRPHPDPDVIVVAPATFNSTAKIALGLADNQALTMVTESLTIVPVVLFPCINAAHSSHPAWASHMAALEECWRRPCRGSRGVAALSAAPVATGPEASLGRDPGEGLRGRGLTRSVRSGQSVACPERPRTDATSGATL